MKDKMKDGFNTFLKYETQNETDPTKNFKILVLTGVHGNEQMPVIALMDIIKHRLKEFDTASNIQSITFVNGANIDGLLANNRFQIPPDNGGDLNRHSSYNTDPDSIITLIDEHDILIDIHASPNMSKSAVLIDANFQSDSIIKKCDESELRYVVRYSTNDTNKKYALKNGKTAFTLEIDGMNNWDNRRFTIKDHTDFIIKSIKVAAELHSEGIKQSEKVNEKHLMNNMYMPCDGMVTWENYNSDIEKDELLCTIHNPIGEYITGLYAERKIGMVQFPEKILYKEGEVIALYFNID